MLSDEKIDELIELIDDEIPVRDVPVTIDTYRPAIREAVRKWYAAQQSVQWTLATAWQKLVSLFRRQATNANR